MRELLGQLPQLYDGAPIHASVPEVSTLFTNTITLYRTAKETSECFIRPLQPPGGKLARPIWHGSIDMHLEAVLYELEVADRTKSRTQIKRERAKGYMEYLVSGRDDLAQDSQTAFVRAWMAHDQYFNNVTHGKETTEDEFRTRIEECVSMLLRFMKPLASEVRNEIDQLVNDAEGGVRG